MKKLIIFVSILSLVLIALPMTGLAAANADEAVLLATSSTDEEVAAEEEALEEEDMTEEEEMMEEDVMEEEDVLEEEEIDSEG